jgi:hypothetical protein
LAYLVKMLQRFASHAEVLIILPFLPLLGLFLAERQGGQLGGFGERAARQEGDCRKQVERGHGQLGVAVVVTQL